VALPLKGSADDPPALRPRWSHVYHHAKRPAVLPTTPTQPPTLVYPPPSTLGGGYPAPHVTLSVSYPHPPAYALTSRPRPRRCPYALDQSYDGLYRDLRRHYQTSGAQEKYPSWASLGDAITTSVATSGTTSCPTTAYLYEVHAARKGNPTLPWALVCAPWDGGVHKTPSLLWNAHNTDVPGPPTPTLTIATTS